MPETASELKQERIRRAGATLVVEGNGYADALAASLEWAARSGAMVIHAYDQAETILGQGTVALELEEQIPEADTVLVGVGGGGLIAGIATWLGGRRRVVGVEPELSPTFTSALAAGGPVDAPAESVARSLSPKRVGDLVFPIASRHVERTVLVADHEILSAQRALWEAIRVWPEPEGAAAFAALRSGRYRPTSHEHVGVIVSGGNATMDPAA